ncbi:MAG: Flp pilus assembly complex ATPase component TadA, partial [Candidatus Omnitrophica bacterium]|nr:Flp pilus assembly complex ATPase component TadA [Candidatus Omnitrophota bacterium]
MPRSTVVDVLLKQGLITQEQIKKATDEKRKTGLSLEKALIKLGFVTDEDIADAIARETGIPYMDLTDYLIDPAVLKYIPESIAKKYKIVPLFKIGDVLTCAMLNPRDIMAIDEVRLKSKVPNIEPVLATEAGIQKVIDSYYGVMGSVDDVIKKIDKEKLIGIGENAKESELIEIAEDAPIVKLVNFLITQAVKDRASDIHIEPDEHVLRIRYRIDGILHEIKTPPKHLQNAIVSRIKILSKMDIAERRKPQDGKISLRMEGKDLDLRVSIFPTVHGENVVLRILDKTSVILGLKELGFSKDTLNLYDDLIKKPYGIILVTGPTGSGKTTTLYASLSTINTIEKNIITIEDPVEYQLPLIRQTQIEPKKDLTFATGLRTIVRQDPDIIMVGEIRDKETADIAIQAALTGHLVFSTLHTNDSTSAVARLTDMQVEPFLISSSVVGVLAQRLVRTICPKCKVG